MDEFRLVYFHKETGKKYLGKMASRLDYVLLDPETSEKIRVTRHHLMKNYHADPGNKKSSKRNNLLFKNKLTKKAS